MVNIFGRSDQQKASGSPKGEVGEIDTRAPFQSVRAAVSLFGEVALSKGKTTVRSKSKLSSESVLHKETQLLLAQKQVNKYKKQLEGDEATNKRIKSELETAKRTLNDLTTKLKAVSDSKQAALEAAQVIKKLAEQLEPQKSQKQQGNAGRKQELDLARELYKTTAAELDVAKQQLTEIRQDFDAALDAKLASFQQAAEARRSTNMNMERVTELSKEIKVMRESAQQVKLAAAESQEQQAKIVAEKDARIKACKIGVAEAKKNSEVLKKEYKPDMVKHLESRLAEITADIDLLQTQMKKAHDSEMDAVKVVTRELNEATNTLREISDEEGSYRDIITTLRRELENLKRGQAEFLKEEAEKKSRAEEEGFASDDSGSALRRLSSEAENCRQEAEEMMTKARELKRETENATLIAEEAEKKLKLFLEEADNAKDAEKIALNEMKIWSQRRKIEEPGSPNTIRVSLDDYTSMKKKVEELEQIAKIKEADAITELEKINARQAEAATELEASLKAIEEIEQATDIALKSAEMAEAAYSVVEGELLKWRQQEHMITP